jgi:hypothetical protein
VSSTGDPTSTARQCLNSWVIAVLRVRAVIGVVLKVVTLEEVTGLIPDVDLVTIQKVTIQKPDSIGFVNRFSAVPTRTLA